MNVPNTWRLIVTKLEKNISQAFSSFYQFLLMHYKKKSILRHFLCDPYLWTVAE